MIGTLEVVKTLVKSQRQRSGLFVVVGVWVYCPNFLLHVGDQVKVKDKRKRCPHMKNMLFISLSPVIDHKMNFRVFNLTTVTTFNNVKFFYLYTL